MRKRWKEPKVRYPTKKRSYFWFRITDSYGKKPVFRFSSYDQAKKKIGELHNQLLNTIYSKPLDRIGIEAAIDFYLKGKKDMRGVTRYYDYKKNFLGFAEERGVKFIDEITSELMQEYMLWRQNYGMRKDKQGQCK